MTLRMPMAVAARKGISAVAATAAEERVVLISHGRTVAVIDDAARLDETVRMTRDAALAVLDAAADLAAGRGNRLNLDEVCSRLGLDASEVRARAAERHPDAAR